MFVFWQPGVSMMSSFSGFQRRDEAEGQSSRLSSRHVSVWQFASSQFFWYRSLSAFNDNTVVKCNQSKPVELSWYISYESWCLDLLTGTIVQGWPSQLYTMTFIRLCVNRKNVFLIYYLGMNCALCLDLFCDFDCSQWVRKFEFQCLLPAIHKEEIILSYLRFIIYIW